MGKELILLLECWYMDFDEQGKVMELGFIWQTMHKAIQGA